MTLVPSLLDAVLAARLPMTGGDMAAGNHTVRHVAWASSWHLGFDPATGVLSVAYPGGSAPQWARLTFSGTTNLGQPPRVLIDESSALIVTQDPTTLDITLTVPEVQPAPQWRNNLPDPTVYDRPDWIQVDETEASLLSTSWYEATRRLNLTARAPTIEGPAGGTHRTPLHTVYDVGLTLGWDEPTRTATITAGTTLAVLGPVGCQSLPEGSVGDTASCDLSPNPMSALPVAAVNSASSPAAIEMTRAGVFRGLRLSTAAAAAFDIPVHLYVNDASVMLATVLEGARTGNVTGQTVAFARGDRVQFRARVTDTTPTSQDDVWVKASAEVTYSS